MAVEFQETRLENKRVREKNDRKDASEYFGANLAHLLNLVQVTNAKDLSPVWEALARASKHNQLLVLQRAFDTAAKKNGATRSHHSDALPVKAGSRAWFLDGEPV